MPTTRVRGHWRKNPKTGEMVWVRPHQRQVLNAKTQSYIAKRRDEIDTTDALGANFQRLQGRLRFLGKLATAKDDAEAIRIAEEDANSETNSNYWLGMKLEAQNFLEEMGKDVANMNDDALAGKALKTGNPQQAWIKSMMQFARDTYKEMADNARADPKWWRKEIKEQAFGEKVFWRDVERISLQTDDPQELAARIEKYVKPENFGHGKGTYLSENELIGFNDAKAKLLQDLGGIETKSDLLKYFTREAAISKEEIHEMEMHKRPKGDPDYWTHRGQRDVHNMVKSYLAGGNHAYPPNKPRNIRSMQFYLETFKPPQPPTKHSIMVDAYNDGVQEALNYWRKFYNV